MQIYIRYMFDAIVFVDHINVIEHQMIAFNSMVIERISMTILWVCTRKFVGPLYNLDFYVQYVQFGTIST